MNEASKENTDESISIAKEVIKSLDFSPDYEDICDNKTPLQNACQQDCEPLVRVLLEFTANPDLAILQNKKPEIDCNTIKIEGQY